MMTFSEYIAQSRTMNLPDTHTMLSMAGVGLDSPDEEETKRMLNRDKKRPLAPRSGRTRKAKPIMALGGGSKPAVG